MREDRSRGRYLILTFSLPFYGLPRRLLVDRTIKFSLTLFLDAEFAFFEEACIPMGFRKVLTDSQSFHVQQCVCEGVVLYSRHNLNMSHRSHVRVNNALLISIGGLISLGLRSFPNFLLRITHCVVPIL